MTWEETKAFLSPCFPQEVRDEMELLLPGELREIRVRAGQPTAFITASRTALLSWQPTSRQVEALAEALSGHSLYARADETRQGYITLRGGHRMGLCGHVSGSGALADIGSLCIRIAGQWPGCADMLLPLCREGGAAQSLLLIGPPGSGKTTLLRDLARQLSAGGGALQTAVIDERGELAACVHGVPQLDIGCTADVLDGLSKPGRGVADSSHGPAAAGDRRAFRPGGRIRRAGRHGLRRGSADQRSRRRAAGGGRPPGAGRTYGTAGVRLLCGAFRRGRRSGLRGA